LINRRPFKLFCIIFLYTLPALYGNSLGEAAEYEKKGEYEKAFYYYGKWLEENNSDNRFSDVLFKAASLVDNSDKTIDFYLNYIDSVHGPDLIRLYYEVARLYEMTFRYSFAADYYRMALNASTESLPELELHLLRLLYQSGDIPDTSRIDALLMADISPDIYVDALLFKAEVLQYQNQSAKAEEILIQSRYSNLYPEIQYSLWEIYNRTGNHSESQRVLSFMQETYPDSVELALMEGRTEKMTRMSDFFLSESDPEQIYVQTGVFSRRDYALVLKGNLRNMGFNAIIVESESLFKVLVSGTDRESLLNRLKENGIEGFIADYP
jgi:tetratricopeptide (TPR) repeat protein